MAPVREIHIFAPGVAMKRFSLALGVLFFAAVSAAQTIPELFGRAREQIKAGSWAEAAKTLDALDAESSKPGQESIRKQLEGPLAFYRGVCDANLGESAKAVEAFGAFLKLQPGATIDAAVYSKKAVAAFEKAQKAAAARAPSIAEAYKEFRPAPDAKDRDPIDEHWGEGPVKWIMTPEEKDAWAAPRRRQRARQFRRDVLGSARRAARRRRPDLRQEFERRVAFADANLAEEAEQRGSVTDRGMVFVLLGPPTYAGRKPMRAGDDASDNAGLSTVGSQDANIAEFSVQSESVKRTTSGRSITSGTLATQSAQYGGPGKKAAASGDDRMEVWHYRRELLPKGIPYHQVDFQFVTKKGYGANVLQRESETVNTLEAAKTTVKPAG